MLELVVFNFSTPASIVSMVRMQLRLSVLTLTCLHASSLLFPVLGSEATELTGVASLALSDVSGTDRRVARFCEHYGLRRRIRRSDVTLRELDSLGVVWRAQRGDGSRHWVESKSTQQ